MGLVGEATRGSPHDARPVVDQPPPVLSVVSPCYNEEAGVDALVARIDAACRASVGQSYEIVLVNDGSRDATWSRIRAAANANPHVVGVDLSRNHGHQLALTAGLRFCRGQRILILDADLQDPPELLPRMMALMDQGADVVYGQRTTRHGESAFKRWTAKAFYRLLGRLTDIDIPLDTGDFRLMSRRALDVLNAMPENHRFIRGMVSWVGFHQVPLPYERAPRHAGETHYPLVRMIRLALDAITAFSVRPLRMASILGLLVAIAAVGLALYVIHQWTAGQVVQGWTSLMVVVLLLGSVQLMTIGLIGEYLGRLYLESKRRPLFVVADVVRAAPQPTSQPATTCAPSAPSPPAASGITSP